MLLAYMLAEVCGRLISTAQSSTSSTRGCKRRVSCHHLDTHVYRLADRARPRLLPREVSTARCGRERMNGFQRSLASKVVAQELVPSIFSRWLAQRWFKPGSHRWSARRALPASAPADRADSPLPTVRCGACHHFRNDPAWVAGVFSGFPGLGSAHASACAADGVCRLNHRARSAAFSCGEFLHST